MNKILLHIKTVLKHKYYVLKFMTKAGYFWQGLIHDLSKFHPTEFLESIKYVTGTNSPINNCKQDKGYSLAWQHHKGCNPHHYEYWVDKLDGGGVPIKMPFKYMIELICDYLAAGHTYSNFSYQDEYNWICKFANKKPKIHPITLLYIQTSFKIMSETNSFLTKQQIKDIKHSYEQH